jgi:membrane protease YdiL (CAAX protease family)
MDDTPGSDLEAAADLSSHQAPGPLTSRAAPVRDLALFITVAYAFTWVVWVPRALHDQEVIAWPGVGSVAAVWSWAPAVAAVGVAAVTGGRSALHDLGRRLLQWRVPPLAWAAALLGPVALWVLVLALHVLLGGDPDDVRPAAVAVGLGGVLPLLLLLWLTDGLGEETGWRGYALPRLLHRVGPVGASCLLAVVWAVWHLPLLWTDGVSLEGQPFPLVLLDCLLMAALYTWLFLRSHGSALLAVVLHGGLNAFAPPYPQDGDPTLPLLLGLALKAAVAAAAVLALGRTRREDRVVAPGSASDV